MYKLLLAFLILSTAGFTQERFVQTDEARLFCQIMGQGSPIIVIHGGPGHVTHEHLLPHMAPLAEHHLVIFYDQRCRGRSTGEVSPDKISIKNYVEDLDGIRRSLGLEKISLLGHSWGGFLAMHYAITHPDAVDKLILLSTMPASSEDLVLFLSEVAKRLTPYKEELGQIEASPLYLAGDPDTVVKWLRIVFQAYLYRPDEVNKLNLSQSRKSALNGIKIAKIFNEQVFMKPFNLLKELQKLKCPTLIIHGDVDPIPLETAEHIHKAIHGSKFLKMERCGHFPPLEQPEGLFPQLEEFLK